jgi:LacI family repressor for deo operon, udp, cdd, tsx, nupC, and nupG
VRATMKHVAELAGVSIKTVSNVVNGYEHVTEQTRSRVQQAIDDLGFVPNGTARSLRSGRSGVVALALPELNAPYFAELAHHVVLS